MASTAFHQSNAGPSRYSDTSPPIPPSKSPSPAFDDSETYNGQSNGRNHRKIRSNGDLAGESDDHPRESDRQAESRRNPLVDLIDSEKIYVEQLGLIIRRVAAAWSRKDFPPPKLDTMFRSVEAVYRANRGFGQKLKDIGPNPSSPKALGDLLMRWVDDLEPAYSRYCSTFMSGFDSYPPIMGNALLPNILSDISSIATPTPPLQSWSLDALFILPYARLRYYRKLYARLLRSTKEGRSDHKLLVVANQRLDNLVSEVETRLEVDVAEDDLTEGSGSGENIQTREPMDSRGSREQSWQQQPPANERTSQNSSLRDSSGDSQNISPFSSRIEDGRGSAESAATSLNPSPPRRPPNVHVPTISAVPKPSMSTPTLSISPSPLTDLELRIDPERTIDLFTMKPKKCKLQMNPPTLPFTRFLRSAHDVQVHFTPRCTGQQVVHSRAHVFILSDLFLVAEWMDAHDKAAKAQQLLRDQPERIGQGGPMPEMWLSYPPLAGKHLTVAEGTQANVLTVTIMKKETFVIHAESEVAKDQLLSDLMGCIDFASTAATRRSNTGHSPVGPDARSPSSLSDNRSMEGQFPPFRQPSPFSAESSPTVSPRPGDAPHIPPPPMQGNALLSQINQLTLEPGEMYPSQGRRGSSPQVSTYNQGNGGGGNALPPRGASLSGKARAPSGPPSMAGMSPQFYSDSALNVQPGGVFQPGQIIPGGPGAGAGPGPGMGAQIPRSPSGRSVQSAPRMMDYDPQAPPMPPMRGPGSHLSDGSAGSWQGHMPPSRSRSAEPLRPLDPPSARYGQFPGRGPSPIGPNGSLPPREDDSPPMSPVEEESATLTGPAVISAQMKCKVFLKQSHQQWKSLGSGKLKLYAQAQGHGNVKQLVVESDGSNKQMLISTIVLTDGVERVAKTGVAVEISDRGKRTGIVYMIQLRNETSAAGLFESLLAGSDRTTGR